MAERKTHYKADAGVCAVLTREPLCGGGLSVKVWAVGEPSLVTCGKCRVRRTFKALATEPDDAGREEEENQMTQRVVVEANASLDEAGRQPLPRLIGPFADREAAEAHMAEMGPLWGSWSVVPLTEPDVEGSDHG